MRAYVVSDKKRSSYVQLVDALQTQEFDVEIVDAVFLDSLDEIDSNTGKPLVDQKITYARMGRSITLGEAGCALAHVNVYKAFLQTGDEWALVCEDDAVLIERDTLCRVQKHLQSFDVERIIFSLFTTDLEIAENDFLLRTCYEPPVKVFSAMKEVILDGSETVKQFQILFPSTVAYFVNRAAAQMLVEAQTPVTSNADWPVSVRDITFFYKRAFSTTDMTSVIGDDFYKATRKHIPLTFTFIWYFRYRKYFPSLFFYIDRFMSRRLRKIPYLLKISAKQSIYKLFQYKKREKK